MSTAALDKPLEISQEIEIAAGPEKVFDSLLRKLSDLNETPQGPMPMKLEAQPGGRWFRDLGEQSGHLWGHVQVIKAPKLLEICGPLFMSFPAVNHLQFRLEPTDGGTLIAFQHTAIGLIPDEFRAHTGEGWAHYLKGVKEHAEHS